jgi:hypothetical protein
MRSSAANRPRQPPPRLPFPRGFYEPPVPSEAGVLDTRQVPIEPNTPIAHVYFPEAGMSSVTNNSSGGKIEVGVVGREGLVGLPNLGLDPPVRRAVTCYLLAVTMGAIALPSQTHVGPASPSRFT